MRNDKVYYGIRIIAGIYVIYIACDTFRKVAAGETGKNAVPLTAASIAILGNCKSEKNFQFSRKGIRPGGDGSSGRISGSGG